VSWLQNYSKGVNLGQKKSGCFIGVVASCRLSIFKEGADIIGDLLGAFRLPLYGFG
jgi:hypothetical protein